MLLYVLYLLLIKILWENLNLKDCEVRRYPIKITRKLSKPSVECELSADGFINSVKIILKKPRVVFDCSF